MKVIETGKKDKWEVRESPAHWQVDKAGTVGSDWSSALRKDDGFTREDAQALADRKNGEAVSFKHVPVGQVFRGSESGKLYIKGADTTAVHIEKSVEFTFSPDADITPVGPILAIITGDLSKIEGPYTADGKNNKVYICGINQGMDSCIEKQRIVDALNLLHQLKQ